MRTIYTILEKETHLVTLFWQLKITIVARHYSILTITRNIKGYYGDCKWITGKKSEFSGLIIFPKSQSCLQN